MADFLTVNLSSVLNVQKRPQLNQDDKVEDESQNDNSKGDLGQSTDWGNELKKRLAANNSLSKEARVDDYEIESKFFTEYFNNAFSEWDAACAKQLLSMGEPLKKVLKVLGFDRKVNPILGFLLTPFGISLIKEKLLNINTFKALYNAVAKKLVAHTEFFKENDYNILYCRDLWQKSPTEIIMYLKKQNMVLPASTSSYSAASLDENRELFFTANGKLNELKFIEERTGTAVASEEATMISSKKQQAIVDSISNEPAEVLAAIQFIYTNSDSSMAEAALTNRKLAEVPVAKLVLASKKIAHIMPKNKLAKPDADELVQLLLGKL